MKILVVTNVYPSKEKPYAGIFVKNQVNFISGLSGVSVDIFAMRRTFTGKAGGVRKYIWAFVAFSRNFLKRYDAVHLHFFFPLILPCVLYKIAYPKTKLVVTLHGSDVHLRFRSVASRVLFSRAAKKIDYIQAVGGDLANEFESKLARPVDAVFPAGIDKEVFKPLNGKKKYDFIFVGSFVERKGMDLFVSAASRLKGHSICFVGSGPLEGLTQALSKSNTVTVKRDLSQRDVAVEMSLSKFLVLPSRYEPFGLVVSEALFCGTPAIVSGADGLKAQIEHGVNGFIVDCDVDSLYDSLRTAVKMSEEEYEELSRKAASSNREFELASICNRLVEIYKS